MPPITQVDAFTPHPFAGNPAAVCVLPAAADDTWMQNVAREMNLSETAFLVRQTDGFQLRWFTPTTEVDLCGHATLASAHVLWSEGHLPLDQTARFHTRSGLLTARRSQDWIELNFPASHSSPTIAPDTLNQALGVTPRSTYANPLGYLVELADEATVRHLQPDFGQLATLPVHGVIVTSRATTPDFDFVSRFFAPGLGINEDPVTGAAHCCLAPFWRDRLQKNHFTAYQASARGGIVKLRYDGQVAKNDEISHPTDGDRVYLSGQAVTVLKGELITNDQ